MCDPLTAIMGAVGAATSLFGGGKDTPAPPPPPKPPAIALDKARDPNAVVRVGDGTTANANTSTPAYEGFTEKRVTGRPLGGLGRGGLGL